MVKGDDIIIMIFMFYCFLCMLFMEDRQCGRYMIYNLICGFVLCMYQIISIIYKVMICYFMFGLYIYMNEIINNIYDGFRRRKLFIVSCEYCF